MWEFLVNSFHQYDPKLLVTLLQTPSFYGTIMALVILEATLSCDNAIVLAICVKHLPPLEQKHALHWGIAGAYIFRFIAIGLGVMLVKLWWVKAIGGGYLLWMAGKFFYGKLFCKDENHDDIPDNVQKGLWATIATVEMMDIAFSADSVLAAFGVSELAWVLLIGGMMGILCMRFAAQLFVKLLERVPELETAAYVLIGIIGAKMIMSLETCKIDSLGVCVTGPGYHMGEWTFVSILVAIFGGTMIINYLKPKPVEA